MKRLIASAGLAALLAACAPLQQAPLVYSSKSVFGLDISATTTETPGASFALGYKSVDAAYVPVAVAKVCDPASANCSGDSFRLVQIGGGFRAVNTNVPDDAKRAADLLLQQFQQAQDELKAAGLAQEAADRALKKAQLDLSDETKRLQDIEGKAEGARSADEKQALAGKDKRLGDLQKAVAEKERAFATAKQKADERERAAKAFDPKALSDAQKLATGNTDKNDAYSVFGSFDANTKSEISANAPKQDSPAQAKIEPSLVLGKVFSTGVASQNLTEGMQRYYASMSATRTAQAVSDCVAAAAKVAETLKGSGEDVVKLALEACKTIDKLQQQPSAPEKLLPVREVAVR